MPNPLDPIWQSYQTTLNSFGVVRSSLGAGAARPILLRGSQFAVGTDQQILDALATATADIDDQAVMFLYASFEAVLRDHVIAQSALFAGAVNPSAAFGLNLQTWFTALCGETRMDKVIQLFVPSATPTDIGKVGSIRKYCHWLAHGKRGAAPPTVTPPFTYTALTNFLQACSLA